MLPMLLRRQRSKQKPPSGESGKKSWQARRRKLQKHLPRNPSDTITPSVQHNSVNTSVSDSTASNGNQSASIRERPKGNTAPKEKQAPVPKARQCRTLDAQKDTAYENSHVGRPETTARQVTERARRSYRREAQRKMARQTQKTAKAAAVWQSGSGGSCQSGSGSYWDASRFNRRYRAVRHFLCCDTDSGNCGLSLWYFLCQ